MPTITTKFLQLVRVPNSMFMNQFVAHQTTFFQIEVPILKKAICFDYDGPLQMLILHVFAFKRPKQNACILIVMNYLKCKTCFTNEHLLMQTTTRLTTSICNQPKIFNPIESENLVNASDLLPFLNVKSNTFKVDS